MSDGCCGNSMYFCPRWSVSIKRHSGSLGRLRSSNCNSDTIAFAGASCRAVSYFTLSCKAGFLAAAGKVKNNLACETYLKFHFADLSSTQLMVSRCQNSTANTT